MARLEAIRTLRALKGASGSVLETLGCLTDQVEFHSIGRVMVVEVC
jgi:hypothetical protein